MEKQFSKYRFNAILGSILLGALIGWLMFKSYYLGALFAFLILIVFLDNSNKQFSKQYKDAIVKHVLRDVVDSYTYHRRRGFIKTEVYATQLVIPGNRYHSEDLIKGIYKGIPFELADVFISNRKNRGKRSVEEVIFKGQWLRVDNLKPAPSPVLIFNKAMRNTYSTSFYRDILTAVELESVAFNAIYKVFGLKDHDVFYMLTPEVIERLVALREARVSLSYSGKEINLAIRSYNDMLEPQLFSSRNMSEEIYRYQIEMRKIFDVLDILLIQQKTFKPIKRYANT